MEAEATELGEELKTPSLRICNHCSFADAAIASRTPAHRSGKRSSSGFPLNFSIFPWRDLWPTACILKEQARQTARRRIFMNHIEYSTPPTLATVEIADLVRGQEHALVERVAPLARSQSVRLDMHCVERIDAAGIAALITLYRAAHESGHEFSIAHATPRVKEILSLVGILHLLTTEGEEAQTGESLPLVCSDACM
jgi:anti-anti-sigma factor